MDFLKHLVTEHFGWFAGSAIAGAALLVLLIAWMLRTARADRKSAKRELYVLATLKRILFSKESAEEIMEDLEKQNTPLDETMAQPTKAITEADIRRTSGEKKS